VKTVFTDAYIKSIKKPGRYTDASTRGLNFNVKNGRGYWVFRYKYGEKRLDLSLGAYPSITLKRGAQKSNCLKECPSCREQSQKLTGGLK